MSYDLWGAAEDLMAANAIRVADMRVAGVQLAENEAEYRKALRLAILEERANRTPVTIISDLCRGREDIADLKLARDASEAIYKSYQEEINVNKLRIRVLEGQLKREWGMEGDI